ncbi:helix-turn-helix transcriptional regulator [Paroceanicella profunda]|uniref:Helix-turn-helix transcriptional regulator n=2 Tax=Paroceanicella profunda TaxID=2579971 RepID=A0A5B8G394_9RHOB|nr:helix-turn-helix transcriptional regulator [Paroceanicella profunda]
MPPGETDLVSPANCPCRLLLDQISDKWSVLILAALCAQPLRFNQVRRQLEGITQKALTRSLRKLERNGILSRRVIASSPVAVEYAITPLGRTLEEPISALYRWTHTHLPEVEQARAAYDQRMTEEE